ncbi:hypothetical protein [Bacillus sp. JJ722]|uniref:hypothetical protein n=1 Tax=Bacillus sp. JJ722 TaxID=3122973 RepID=UPI0030002A65
MKSIVIIGGGKVVAALRPIHRREKVYRLLATLISKFDSSKEKYSFQIINVNG